MKPPTLLCLILGLVLHLPVRAVPNYFGTQYVIPPAKGPSSIKCYRTVPRCIALRTTTAATAFQCLDVTLPYRHTYPPVSTSTPPSASVANTTIDEPAILVDFEVTIKAINEYLSRWNGLRAVPQCWKALQYVLCASFFPRCDDTNHRISLPTEDMCRAIRGPCRLVDQHYYWPDWLQCENTTLFSQKSSHCFNEYKEVKLSPSAEFRCHPPLVGTDERAVWYPNIDGCALRCDRNPVYSEADQKAITAVINYGTTIGLLVSGFGVLTFLIIHRSSRYPSNCIFFVNICLFISFSGWLLQHFDRRFTCHPDNTIRYGALSQNRSGHFLCLLSFFTLYYFSMAALFWLLLFAYGCTIVYAPKGSGQLPAETLLRKKTVFHLIAWALPFILLLMILLLGEIDGDSLYGICFVGFASSRHFVFFVLVPVTGALGAFLYFMGLAVVQLWLMMRFNMQTDKNPTRCALKCRKIWRVILRMLLGVLWSLVAYITAIIIYIYQLSYNREYARQLNQYIVCNLNISNALEPKENGSFLAASAANNNLDLPYSDSYDGFGQPNPSPCQALAPKPVLWPLHLQLAIIFGNVILAFTWISTYSTWRSWKHFLEKRFNKEYYMQNRERLKRLRQEEAAEQDVDELQKTIAASGNAETKRQRLGLASGMLTSFASFTSRHWDPVEMELSSFNSYSWTASIKEKIYPLFGGRVSQNGSHSRAAAAAAAGQQAPVTSITSNTLGTSTVDVSSDQNSSVTLGHSVESSSLAAAEAKNVPSNTEGRRRKSRKKFMRLKRRGSDTSGSILSAAFVTIPKSRLADHSRLVTKSTSTGDLVVLQTPSGAQLNMVSSLTPTIPPGGQLNLPPFATLPLSPFLPSPGLIAALQQQNSTSAQQAAPPLGPSMPFSHNLAAFANGQAATMPSVLRPPGLFQSNMLQRPQMVSQPAAIRAPVPAPTSIPPRRSVAHASQSTFTFTHGFSEQSPKELINPFTEKRRPDSSLSSSNNTTNTNFIVQRATNNLATRSPHLAANAHNQMISQAVAASASVPQHQLAQLYQAAAAGSSATLNQLSALSAMASIGSHNLSPYHLLASPWTAMNGTVYNTKLALEYLDQIQQQSMTPAEYAALVQEREALKSLVTGRSSAASSNNGPLIPTLMSDSEFSTYSDASRASQYPELSAAQVKAIQREVDERLHKVEQKETEAARGRQHPVGKEVTASSKGKKKQQQQQQSKSKSKVKNKRGKKDQDLENPEDRDGQPDLGKDTEEDSGTAVQ